MHLLTNTICASTLVLAMTASGAMAAVVDTIDAATGQADTFFVPALGQELDSPFYRFGGSWIWQHNPIAAGFSTAVLNVGAYDVDEAPCGFTVCENDEISAFDAATDTWVLLGSLIGDDNSFSFTQFDLLVAAGGALVDDIIAGLIVGIAIDVDDGGWAVSLSRSVITTDGADPGDANPSVVPIPAGGLLLASGLLGLGALRRRRKA